MFHKRRREIVVSYHEISGGAFFKIYGKHAEHRSLRVLVSARSLEGDANVEHLARR